MSKAESVNEYLKEIRKYPLLSFEQEIELSRRIQSGDLAAQKELIESNLRLVVAIARKFSSCEIPLLDIIQEGNLGLITAAQKFSFSYKVRFSTYACWWIQQSITRAIANKKRLIRLPFRKEELLYRIRRASAELYQKNACHPTNSEIATYLSISIKDVSDLMQYATSISSLDAQIEDEDSFSMKDFLSDSTYNPEEEFMKKYTVTCLVDMLSSLKENERDIVIKRYNLDKKGKTKTLKKLGLEIGVSAETVRQVEIKAIKKLRAHSEDFRELCYR